MSAKRWVLCPGCERMAETSGQLTAKGCEGRHIEVMAVEELRGRLTREMEKCCKRRDLARRNDNLKGADAWNRDASVLQDALDYIFEEGDPA